LAPGRQFNPEAAYLHLSFRHDPEYCAKRRNLTAGGEPGAGSGTPFFAGMAKKAT
jgi:hypothetical protein